MDQLLKKISKCDACMPHLTLGPRPIVRAHRDSKILIIGQAPGAAGHKSGIAWDDKSGENLRSWMDIDNETFYTPEKVGIIPMGFCYPGKGKSGDLPPRKECAPMWHEDLISQMEKIELVMLIGKYAQDYYLKRKTTRTLTDTVKNYYDYLPHYFVLPHPSPMNNIWQAKNPWFKEEVLPSLRETVEQILKQ